MAQMAGLQKRSGTNRERAKAALPVRIGIILICATAGLFLVPAVVLVQQNVSCTEGERRCQVDTIMECECFYFDDVEQVTCRWNNTYEACGSPPGDIPRCTADRRGATAQFPDGIKMCVCEEENSDECSWSEEY